jgi:hypothetical protein
MPPQYHPYYCTINLQENTQPPFGPVYNLSQKEFATLREYLDKKHIWIVLQKLCDARLYVKLEKCIFHQPQVEFLGYIITKKGLFMDPKKI